jgi:hypothetical protein
MNFKSDHQWARADDPRRCDTERKRSRSLVRSEQKIAGSIRGWACEGRIEVISVLRVLIDVRSGAARFEVAVRAQSIQRAMNIVGARYPGGYVRVKFPIDPAAFFVNDLAAAEELIEYERPQGIAAWSE